MHRKSIVPGIRSVVLGASIALTMAGGPLPHAESAAGRPSTPQQSVAPDVGWSGRGCCSWHGGVCGCSNGRALCCDGQLSPTCGC